MINKNRELTLEEFRAEIKAQDVEPLDYAFICPACNTVQSARWLIAEGVGNDFDEVQCVLGFSCVGRFTGTSSDRVEGIGCNWTCGGLLQIHKLTVITPDEKKHPYFEVASQQQAHELRSKLEVSND